MGTVGVSVMVSCRLMVRFWYSIRDRVRISEDLGLGLSLEIWLVLGLYIIKLLGSGLRLGLGLWLALEDCCLGLDICVVLGLE